MELMAQHWPLDDGPAAPGDGNGNGHGDEEQDRPDEREEAQEKAPSEMPDVANEHVEQSPSHDQPDIQPQHDVESLRLQRKAVVQLNDMINILFSILYNMIL